MQFATKILFGSFASSIVTEQVHGWVLHESNEKKKNDFTKII